MLEDAIAAVPPEVIGAGVIVGTPEQVTARLREFGDAGLRHVVLAPLSAFITVRDLVHAGWAVRRVARSRRTGRPAPGKSSARPSYSRCAHRRVRQLGLR
jgi:phthiodiolone/phenolphthiodiolone dimycocerosates ketoreductase